jgi:DNA-binding IclR family transcriptional regulator
MSADGRAADSPQQESPQQGIQSIEVARSCAMHPAKVHRYLVSLVRAGLAPQDARTGQYDLGPAARHLGMESLRRTDAESTAAANTSRLMDQSGHTTNVAVWTEDRAIIVRWDSGTHVLPINVRVGSVLPLLDSAVGVTFLAHLPTAQTAGVLATQQARQETHTPGAAALEKLLVKTRRDGIASSLHRMIYGMAAFGAPVFGTDRPSCSRSAPPCRPACWSRAMGARPTGWPTRSAAPPGRSRPNWDTARRNAPAPTRPQRWRQ